MPRKSAPPPAPLVVIELIRSLAPKDGSHYAVKMPGLTYFEVTSLKQKFYSWKSSFISHFLDGSCYRGIDSAAADLALRRTLQLPFTSLMLEQMTLRVSPPLPRYAMLSADGPAYLLSAEIMMVPSAEAALSLSPVPGDRLSVVPQGIETSPASSAPVATPTKEEIISHIVKTGASPRPEKVVDTRYYTDEEREAMDRLGKQGSAYPNRPGS